MTLNSTRFPFKALLSGRAQASVEGNVEEIKVPGMPFFSEHLNAPAAQVGR